MKEYLYQFDRYDYFLDSMKKGDGFGGEEKVCLILAPYDYELKLSGEILNKASGKGYRAEITKGGAVSLFEEEGTLLCQIGEGEGRYAEFRVEKKEKKILILFGHTETVDHYPNCDGESDRYSIKWIAERGVQFDPETLLLSVFG